MTAELIDTTNVQFDATQELQVEVALTDRLPTQYKSLEVTENGQYKVTPDDGYTLGGVSVTASVSSSVEEINATCTANGTYEIIPTTADAISKATIEVAVPMIIEADGVKFGFSTFEKLPQSVVDYLQTQTDWHSMLYHCEQLTSIEATNLDTSKVTNMTLFFDGCTSLTSVDASGWEMGNVTNISQMFNGCAALAALNVSEWNVGNVLRMNYTFGQCQSLQEIDVSRWNVGNVVNMGGTFANCSQLTALDVANWNTARVTDMSSMFYGCSALQRIDTTGWNTAKVTNMNQMFYGCSSLQSIIGNHTLEEVEAGTIVALQNMGAISYIDLRGATALRYASLLAVAKGAYDRNAAGLGSVNCYIAKAAYNACYNDDGTKPDATTLLARKTELTNILTAKGYYITQS